MKEIKCLLKANVDFKTGSRAFLNRILKVVSAYCILNEVRCTSFYKQVVVNPSSLSATCLTLSCTIF